MIRYITSTFAAFLMLLVAVVMAMPVADAGENAIAMPQVANAACQGCHSAQVKQPGLFTHSGTGSAVLLMPYNAVASVSHDKHAGKHSGGFHSIKHLLAVSTINVQCNRRSYFRLIRSANKAVSARPILQTLHRRSWRRRA